MAKDIYENTWQQKVPCCTVASYETSDLKSKMLKYRAELKRFSFSVQINTYRSVRAHTHQVFFWIKITVRIVAVTGAWWIVRLPTEHFRGPLGRRKKMSCNSTHMSWCERRIIVNINFHFAMAYALLCYRSDSNITKSMGAPCHDKNTECIIFRIFDSP